MIKSTYAEICSVAQKRDSKFVDFGGHMFITVLEGLLHEKGITTSKMLADLGMNKSSVLNWKTRGTVPSGATLQKIADYFGVSVDYLLGKTEQKEKSPSVSDEEIKFALFGGGEITDEMWEEVKRYAEFVKQKYGK